MAYTSGRLSGISLLLQGTVLALISSPAMAQIATEEIVVTAQKREQNLQDVGVSVTAFSSRQIAELGLSSSTNIAAQSPGVVFESTTTGGVNANLTVRGVAQTDFSPNQESPNAIYFDEVYVSSPLQANFSFYDLERIEVLRGPQGTLFGRNSTGGLANFITKRPTREFEAYVDATLGSYNKVRLEGAVGGPLSETVRFRLSGSGDYNDGWWKNNAGHDTYEKKYYGIRGQLEADLTPDFTANLKITYDRNPNAREGVYKQQSTYFDANNVARLLPVDLDAHGTGPGNDKFGYRDIYRNAQEGEFNDFGRLRKEQFSPTLRLNWDMGNGIDFVSISNYTDFSLFFSDDCDGGPGDFCRYYMTQDLKQFSQEARLSGKTEKASWIVGAYYLRVRQKNSQGYDFPALSGTSGSFTDDNFFNQTATSASVFGQLEYEVLPRLTVIAGVRAIKDRKQFDSIVTISELGGVTYSPPLVTYDFSPATVGDAARQSEWDWGGKLQVNFTPSDGKLLYASWSRGVKGAGFNSNLGATLTSSQTPFKGEVNIAYEAGAKLELLDRRLRFNLAGYYYDYRDFQAFQFQGFTSLVTNNDARMYGSEVELAATPMPGLDLILGAAYLKSKVYDVQTANRGVMDQEAINAPRWTANGLIRKKFSLTENTDIALQWDFNYVAGRYSSVDNVPTTYVRSAFVHSARISYNLVPQRTSIALFVNNVSNIDKQTYAFDVTSSFGNRVVSYAPPRWFGVQLRKDF